MMRNEKDYYLFPPIRQYPDAPGLPTGDAPAGFQAGSTSLGQGFLPGTSAW